MVAVAIENLEGRMACKQVALALSRASIQMVLRGKLPIVAQWGAWIDCHCLPNATLTQWLMDKRLLDKVCLSRLVLYLISVVWLRVVGLGRWSILSLSHLIMSFLVGFCNTVYHGWESLR